MTNNKKRSFENMETVLEDLNACMGDMVIDGNDSQAENNCDTERPNKIKATIVKGWGWETVTPVFGSIPYDYPVIREPDSPNDVVYIEWWNTPHNIEGS